MNRAELAHHGGVCVERPAVGEHRHARDALDAASDHQSRLPREDLGRAEVDRVDPRGAEPVDRDARNVVAEALEQHRGAREVGALSIHLRGAAEDHVFGELWEGWGAFTKPSEHGAREGERAQRRQGAAGAGLASRRAKAVEHIDVASAHGTGPPAGERSSSGTQVLWVPLEIRSGSSTRAIGPRSIAARSKIWHSLRSAFMSVTNVTT